MDTDTLKRTILTGIQKGSYDYDSIKLLAGEQYDNVLAVLSRPFVTVDAILDLLELIGIDGIKKYRLKRASHLVYNTPGEVLPLVPQNIKRREDVPTITKPVMIYVKKGEVYSIIYAHKTIKLSTPGFYLIHPGIDHTCVITPTHSYIFTGVASKTYAEIVHLRVYSDAHPVPTNVKSGYAIVTNIVPADKMSTWIPVRENVYYIPAQDDEDLHDIDELRVTFPFTSVQNAVYNTKLLIKIQKIFMVEWMMFTLSSVKTEKSGKLTTEYLMDNYSIYDLDYLKASILGKCNEDDMAKVCMLFSEILDYMAICPTCTSETMMLAE